MSEDEKPVEGEAVVAPETEEIEKNDDIEERASDKEAERASLQGWVPKEEYKGDPDKWVDAKTFLERGEKVIPIMKERQRKLETDLTEMRKTLKEFADYHKGVEERAYNKALKAVKAQKAEAVSLGDKEAFLAAEKQEEELKGYKPKVIDVPEADPEQAPEFQDWLADNPWYKKDRVLHAAADAIAEDLAKTSDLKGRAFFDAVTKDLKKEFPNKFENPRRNSPNAVEGPSGTRRSGKKGYTDLPAEAKSACDKFVKQGLLSREQYVSDYFGEIA